jgi:predicted glycosyltransferase
LLLAPPENLFDHYGRLFLLVDPGPLLYIQSMQIAFYCQNVLGLGHITRSRAILRELTKKNEVTFLQGGQETGIDLQFPSLKKISLPPIMMNEGDGSLYVPESKNTLDEQWANRRRAIESLSDQKFDALVIELYPFGRKQFREEIEFLQDLIRKKNSRLITFCSLRDIMIQKLSEPKRAEQIIKSINKRLDYVIVHSDENLLPLELTWPHVSQIKNKIFYSGFVTETKFTSQQRSRGKEILVSAGGGNVGEDLYFAIANECEKFPEYQFQFVFGPYAKKEFQENFQKHILHKKNAFTENLIKNFEERLSQSRLSISLAGYNTVMNILNTQTPALLYPYQANWEQETRLNIFEKSGCLKVLRTLDPHSVEESIRQALAFTPKIGAINLEGAKQTAEFISSKKKKRFFLFSL